MSKEKDMCDVTPLCSAGVPWRGELPARRHLAVAREAAALERSCEYAMARLSWLDAGRLAVLSPDRHWCESRALLCEKRADFVRHKSEKKGRK